MSVETGQCWVEYGPYLSWRSDGENITLLAALSCCAVELEVVGCSCIEWGIPIAFPDREARVAGVLV